MRCVWICVLLLHTWAATTAYAGADAVQSSSFTASSSQSVGSGVSTADDLEVLSQGRRDLLAPKRSPPKKSPPKKSPPKKSPPRRSPPPKAVIRAPPPRAFPPPKVVSQPPPAVDKAPDGAPGASGAPGSAGSSGASGAPGAPGAPGKSSLPPSPPPPPVSSSYLLGAVAMINSTAYNGSAIDGTPLDSAAALVSATIELTLNYDFTMFMDISNKAMKDDAVLKARLVVANVLGSFDEFGTLLLYEAQLFNIVAGETPGSVKFTIMVFRPLTSLPIELITTFAKTFPGLLGAVSASFNIGSGR